MVNCEHKKVECINYYELIRKYRCLDCGGVFICQCDKRIGINLLPHQLDTGQEYGTSERIRVNGFVFGICDDCRGLVKPCPRAETYGVHSKLDRYYWHEIYKTYLEAVVDWMEKNEVTGTNIIDFELLYPEISKSLKTKARVEWRKIHKEKPKYEYEEETEAEFLKRVEIEEIVLECEYAQEEKDGAFIGKWVNSTGDLVSGEEVAEDYFRLKGFDVLNCERGLITLLVATFLNYAIADLGDPKISLRLRNSTRGWRPNHRNTGLVYFFLPVDFGSPEYYARRGRVVEKCLEELLLKGGFIGNYEWLYNDSQPLRDYLWVNEDYHFDFGRKVLSILPEGTILIAIKWAIQDFWERQSGWPDLLIYKPEENYKFVEVKTPNDELSENQKRWFEWAVSQPEFPCAILRVKKRIK